ncbi:MAG: hypothetical protein NC489_11530 [Ruminococcus flavefaciens]|nr:hypothetical protein [Ruminococcus flavefaciens]
MVLKPNEVAEQLYPVAISYTCEFCGKGKMVVRKDHLANLGIHISTEKGPLMIDHVCTECGKFMKLPEPYPKLEWVGKEEYDQIFPNKE